MEPASPAPATPIDPGVARAIAVVGNGAELARRLGLSKGAIQQWKAAGIPPGRVWEVARLTRIPPHALRPDLFDPPCNYTGAGPLPAAGSAA